MSYTETSSEGWGSRLGGAIKGVLVGAVLFLVSFPLLFWNEGRAVHRAQDLEETKGAVSVQPDKVDPANDGKQVHLAGMAEPEGELKDPDFGVEDKAIRLSRKVEMYQWREEKKEEKKKKLGGGEETVTTYTYKEVWSEKEEPLTYAKRDTAKYNNPPMPSLKSETWQAGVVKVGAFGLSKDVIDLIKEDVPLTVKDPPPSGTKGKEEGFVVRDGMFYKPADLDKSKDSTAPAIGDVHVSYKEVKPQEVSLIAKQDNGTLAASTTKRGGTVLEVRPGKLSKDEMIAKAEEENVMLTWVLRLVGFVLMAVGIFLFFKPFVVFADVIPFVGDLLGVGIGLFAALTAIPLTLITIALGWVFYRPLVGVPLLVAGVAGFVLLIVLARKRKAARALGKGPPLAGAPG